MTAHRRRGRLVFAAILGAVLLTGCSGKADQQDAGASTSPSGAAPGMPQECTDAGYSVAHPAMCGDAPMQPQPIEVAADQECKLPNGLRLRLLSATSKPHTPESQHPERDTVVRTVLEIGNDGADPYVFGDPWKVSTGPGEELTYGPNGYTATGYLTDGGVTQLPERVVPGSAITVAGMFAMPAAGLASGELTYTFTADPDALKPCVFTHVETLIH